MKDDVARPVNSPVNELLVLVVEDEPKYADVLCAYLTRFNHVPRVIRDGSAVVSAVAEADPDFVILDLNLPGQDGLAVCRDIRAISDVPILMLTGRVTEFDRLAGLEAGADDYVCKPFSPLEIMSRISVIMRRARGVANVEPELRFADVALNEAQHRTSVGGQELTLTPVEFQLLRLLLSEPRRVFSRDDMASAAYRDARVVSVKTIDTHARNLRLKLESMDSVAGVQSVYGVGYKIDNHLDPA
ncbi:MAG: response regulator [Pseudomonadota bacterium]